MKKPMSPASKYKSAMRRAERQFNLAITYLQDGAPLDAARCANEGVALAFKAYSFKAQHFAKGGE
jgi:hypothetical protein